MAFTRKFLASKGIEAEVVDEIMEAHVGVVEGLKGEISELSGRITELKGNSAKIDELKNKLDEANSRLSEANDKIKAMEQDDYKGKYESEKAAREKLEADNASKEAFAAKEKAFKAMLKDKQYSDEAMKLIIGKGGYTDKIELDSKGNIKNTESILGDVQSEFSMFTPKVSDQASNPAAPPKNTGGKTNMTKKEIREIKDVKERQSAMAQNMELYGIR